jgi:hypothetical protein
MPRVDVSHPNQMENLDEIPSNYLCINSSLIMLKIVDMAPVPMAERSEARTVFGRSNTGILDSNPTRVMDVCPRFSVLCRIVCR